jgi:hypothetical protein
VEKFIARSNGGKWRKADCPGFGFGGAFIVASGKENPLRGRLRGWVDYKQSQARGLVSLVLQAAYIPPNDAIRYPIHT